MSWSGQTTIFRPFARVLLTMASLPGTFAAGLGVAADAATELRPSAIAQASDNRRMGFPSVDAWRIAHHARNPAWSAPAGSRARGLAGSPRIGQRDLNACQSGVRMRNATSVRLPISSTLYSMPLRPAPTTNQPSGACTKTMPIA